MTAGSGGKHVESYDSSRSQDRGRQLPALSRLVLAWTSSSLALRRRLTAVAGAVVILNGLTWIAVMLVSRHYPVLLGLAALAFGFGLRHAVDPDHIAAIDNATRKLMRDGQHPVATGFFFSLGHSTVVVTLSVLIAVSASFVHHKLPAFQHTGSVIGTSVSALFLLLIGAINLLVLLDLVRTWRRVVQGGSYDEHALAVVLEQRGLLVRLFRPILRVVRHSWQLYPIGMLFGLGFDTASEVGLLSISAVTGASGMPIWSILLLPLAFTAGMALIDTFDGILMLGAYGWASVRPVRKLYYNLNITLLSVLIALVIGGVEGLQVVGTQTGASGGVWSVANRLHFDSLGFAIIGAFAASWVVSILVYKLRGYDLLDHVSPAHLEYYPVEDRMESL
jgi:nickel/cobalt transporter (NiCoT) family protein